MKYFVDTEFLEGPQEKTFVGYKYGFTKPTIDLISIGIVAEDGREYYEISKDFNLKEAWNRYQIKQVSGDARNRYPEGVKEYWIRENILKPIFYDLINKDITFHDYDYLFTYIYFKKLISKYGKTNNQISKEIKNFVYLENKDFGGQVVNGIGFIPNKYPNPEFYAYYADYDWVVFCWIFGRMIDLPKGFPMYCRDLKQILDEKQDKLIIKHGDIDIVNIKEFDAYPKQTNEHNALDDAKWNLELYKFLKQL